MNSDIKDHSNDAQQEAQWLEVVAWLNTSSSEATTYTPTVMDWDDEHESVESLCRLSDATAVIDQQGRRIELLDEDNRQLREMLAGEVETNVSMRNHAHALEERVAELEVHRDMQEAELSSGVARVNELEAELAALKSAPVVMPERRIQALAGVSLFDLGHAKGWNACLDEFARLNGGKP